MNTLRTVYEHAKTGTGDVARTLTGIRCPRCDRLAYPGSKCFGCGELIDAPRIKTTEEEEQERNTDPDTTPAETALSPQQKLRELLREWVPEAHLDEVVEEAEDICDLIAIRFSASYFHHVTERLGQSAAGLALKRELTGTDNESLADAAAKVGVTKQALHKHQVKIRQRLTAVS